MNFFFTKKHVSVWHTTSFPSKKSCSRETLIISMCAVFSSNTITIKEKFKGKHIHAKNQAGREEADKLGILPFTYWVFLTIYNFLAWLGITICVKKQEASNNMSFDS